MIYQEDQSTNPLTEIGLALSMCFFTIFILISAMKTSVEAELTASKDSVELNDSQPNDKDDIESNTPVFILKNGYLIGADGQLIAPKEVTDTEIIVAVNSSTRIEEALRLNSQLVSTVVKFTNLEQKGETP